MVFLALALALDSRPEFIVIACNLHLFAKHFRISRY